MASINKLKDDINTLKNKIRELHNNNIKDPFEFDGPLNLKTSWQTEMPDGTVKVIKMSTCACNVFAEQQRIRVTCGLRIDVLNAKKTKK